MDIIWVQICNELKFLSEYILKKAYNFGLKMTEKLKKKIQTLIFGSETADKKIKIA